MKSALELQNLYLQYMEDTESPTIFHRWSFIAGIGAMLERNIYFPFGHDKIYPNQYVVLLGPPASRKSTAINALGNLLSEAGYRKFAGDKSTKEKFIQDMSNGFDIESEHNKDDEVFDVETFLDGETERSKPDISTIFIKASELHDFLGQNNHEFISWLTHIWDNPEVYHHRTKMGKSDKINKPTISLLGGATSTTFQQIFPPSILDQGMLSRMLLIFGEGRRKKIAFPKTPSPEIRDQLVSALIKIKNSVTGKVSVDSFAEKTLEEIYENWQELPDTRFATYGGRRFTHLIKLSMVNAAMRLSTEINKKDVILANTILSFTETYMPQALGEFGKSDKGKLINSVYIKIKSEPDGISIDALRKSLTNETADIHLLMQVVSQLQDLGKIDKIDKKLETGGKTIIFMATSVTKPMLKKYTDYSLLKESSERPKENPDDFT